MMIMIPLTLDEARDLRACLLAATENMRGWEGDHKSIIKNMERVIEKFGFDDPPRKKKKK